MTILANSNEDRIDQLIGLTRELRRLIDTETHALSERRPLALQETESEKARLARLYWAEISLLRKEEGLTADARKDKVERLTLETKAFNESLAAHESAIKAKKTVSERMIQAIAKGADKLSRPSAGYGHTAAYASGAKPKAFALNSVA